MGHEGDWLNFPCTHSFSPPFALLELTSVSSLTAEGQSVQGQECLLKAVIYFIRGSAD